ncbi:MAG: hypothetical protein SWI22_07990 [Pseudomonadota bacterium]|nr:hypothetical protein [Pseudomonadota bacterium]
MAENTTLAVATLVVALLAAIGGPIATVFVGQRTRQATLRVAQRQSETTLEAAQRQVHGAVVSSNRQKWIDGLREDLAEFIAERQYLAARQADQPRDQDIIRQSTKRLVLLYTRLALRLNPDESDHQQLISMASYHTGRPGSLPEEPDMDAMVALSQKVLKREWNVVKRGD